MPVWDHNIISSPQCILTFTYPVHIVSPYFEILLLTSAVLTWRVLSRCRGAAGPLASLSGVCLCLCVLPCLCECLADRMPGPYWKSRGGKPVTLTYLLWFQSPHIPTYSLTHPVPAAALRMAVLHSKTLSVTVSSTSHSFTWNCAFLWKMGVMCLLTHGVLITEEKTNYAIFLFEMN